MELPVAETVDVLAIAAHRDDAELTCGGTLAKAVRAGHRVGIVDLTQGETGTRGDAATRAAEAERAARTLGVHVRLNAELPDAHLQNDEASRARVIELVRATRPRVVILPFPVGRHPDHRVTSELGRDACYLAGLAKYGAPGGGAAHRPFKLLYALAYREDPVKPSFVVDISDSFDTKMAAIRCYASQFDGAKAAGEIHPTGQDLSAAWRAVPLASRFPRMPKRLVYLDNAATTPVRSEVLEAMLPYLGRDAFGNPSSPHRFGRAARAGVEEAKRSIAEALGAEPGQVIFTSGGTEADNLAVIGCALAAREHGGPFRVAVSAIEHKAVLAAAHAVARLGGEEIILPVDGAGQVAEDALDRALARGVAVVSVMWVNNEIGVVQPVARLAARCHEAGVPFHVDGVQAFGKIPVSLHDVACTLLTISGHKIGAPKGIGALVVRDRHVIEAIIHGGGQQFGIRPGTENVPGIVGLGTAVALAAREQAAFAATVAALRDELERRLLAIVPDAVINAAHGRRAPHVTSVSIPGTDSEALLMHLDLAGIACSSGSACSTGAVEPSHVLTAMGVARELGVAALRFSFGKENTLEDVQATVAALPKIVEKVRALSAVLHR